MLKKITIFFSLSCFTVIFLVITFCLYYTKNISIITKSSEDNREFSEFISHKKKLAKTYEQASWTNSAASTTNQSIYVWNPSTNNFDYNSRNIIPNQGEANINLFTKHEVADIDKNSSIEDYYLENGRLIITEKEKIIWESPNDWWIDDFILADSNSDGMINLNLSLWRSGSFGTSQPFWIQENDMSVNNHFFVLSLNNGEIKQIWSSSRLTEPNCEFQITDIDNDGKNDLIVIEGDYRQKPNCVGNYVAVWKWNGWGFSNEWRSNKGLYSNLSIDKINEKSFIITENK